MSTTYHSGSIMAVTVKEDGIHVTQVDNMPANATDIIENVGPNKTIPVDYRRFPVTVKGTYQTTLKFLVVDVAVLGNKLGPTIRWSFLAGPLRIPLDLEVADGLITIFLKNDNQGIIQYKITLKNGGPTWEREDVLFEF